MGMLQLVLGNFIESDRTCSPGLDLEPLPWMGLA